MPVPASVQTLLRSQNIQYNVTATPQDTENNLIWHDQHLRNVGAAKSVILEDSIGQVQVVIAADSLLDLNAVNRHLSRDLRAAGQKDLKRFFETNQFDTVPALPQIAGLLTLVDQSLVERDDLLLDSGNDEQLIHVLRNEFQQTLQDAIVCEISIPLAPLDFDDSQVDDTAAIIGAVQNFTERRVKQRLEETLELPPLSDTAQRIINLRVDPKADISDLAQIVETDPSLAAQVVSWAASPYYSAPGKIKSIHDAIVRVLGFDMVLNLALGLALGKTLSMPKEGPHGEQPYWEQAVYMAAILEGFVTAIPRDHRPSFGLAYLSGLLHNFGYLVMAEVFPPHFKQYVQLTDANPHVPAHIIERHVLGITREQIAGTLMALWELPEEVVVALRYQNNPNYQGEYHAYAKLLYVAKQMLRQHNIGIGPRVEIPDALFEALHLDRDKACETIESVLESSDDLQHISAALGG